MRIVHDALRIHDVILAVRRFGTATLPDASSFVALLHRAYEQEPPVAP